MVDSLEDLTPARRTVAPGPQAGDHVLAHGLAGSEPGRRTPPAAGRLNVAGVGGGDPRPDGPVLQPARKRLEEGGYGRVGDMGQSAECRDCCGRGGLNDPADLGRHMKKLAGLLDHDQAVAGPEAGCEPRIHEGNAVTAEGNRQARCQRLKGRDPKSVLRHGLPESSGPICSS